MKRRARLTWPIIVFLFLTVTTGAFGYLSVPRVGGLNGTSPTAAMVTSIFTNPAAIGQLEGYHFFFDITPTYYMAEFSREGTNPDTGKNYEDVGLNHLSPVPFLGFTTDFKTDFVTFGVAAYVPFGRGGGWPEDGAQRFELTFQDVKGYYLHPAVSFHFGDMFFLGGGVSGIYFKMESDRSFDLAGFFYDLSEDMLGMKFPQGTVDYESSEWEAVIKTYNGGFGVGWNAGVLIKPLDWLTIGASYTSHINLAMEGFFYLDLPTEQFDLFGLIGLEKGVLSLLTDVAGINSPSRVKGQTKVWMTMPQNFALGVAFQIHPKVVLDTAARWTDWSQYSDMRIEFKSENSDLEIPADRIYFKNNPAWEFGGIIKAELPKDFQLGIGALFEEDSIPERWTAAYNVNADKIDGMIYFSWKVHEKVTWGLGYSQIHFFEKIIDNSVVSSTQSANGRYLTEVYRLGAHIDVNW